MSENNNIITTARVRSEISPGGDLSTVASPRRQPFALRRWRDTATFKTQISDGEQIPCEDYEVGDRGVERYDEAGNFVAFVPFAHLLYVGALDENDQTVW